MKTNKVNLIDIKALFNTAKVERVQLDDLELHAGTQQRLKENKEGIETYAEAMEAGEADNFPALRVVRLNADTVMPDETTLEKGALILADGFTRTGAAYKANLEDFQAEIVEGSLDDAIQFSWVANSMHGQKLDQKDYQALIRKVYLSDPSIKKGDLARGLGCAAKTVSKALGIVEEEFKSNARSMMDKGFSDKEIAGEVYKSEQTVKNWRDAYEEEKKNPEPAPEPAPVNPMKLKFEQVLAMEDLAKQINLLEMLQTRVDENRKKAGQDAELTDAPEAPQQPVDTPEAPEQGNGTTDTPEAPQEATQEEQQDIPFDVTGEPEPKQDDTPKTCWEILGRDKEQVAGLANPKASLKRSQRTAAKEVGEEVANKALEDALAELENN